MNLDLKLLDSFILSNSYVVNFACEKSENDEFFVLTDQGVYVLMLRGDLSYTFPKFSCKKLFVPISTYAACENVGIDVNCFSTYVDRKDLYELALTNEYSVNLRYANKLDIVPTKAEWSPQGLVDSTGCILAVLTSVYSLELYMRHFNKNEISEYVMIANILEEVINEAAKQWENTNRLSVEIKLKQFKKRIHFVSITGFTWGHKFKIGSLQHCALFVGHMNGDITVWSIPEKAISGQDWKPHMLSRYSSQLDRIVTMYWHQTSEFGGGLCFADITGRMNVVHVTDLNKTDVNIDKETSFWSEPDKVAIDKIAVMEHENYTFILAVKQRIILIFGLDKNGEVFGQKACYVDDVYITGLRHLGNTIHVLTLPGIFTELTLTVHNEKIKVSERKIPLKFEVKKYRTHGYFFSKNMVLLGLLGQQWDHDISKKGGKEAVVFIFQNQETKPIDLLWKNTTGSLNNYWDCLEILRVVCIKEKRFPWLGISSDLNYDTLSLYHLKLLRQLAKMSEMVINFVPFVKTYDIKPFIIIHYLLQIKLVVQRLKTLLKQKDLSLFQMRSIDVQNFFLKEMVAKNILAKANVGKTFIEDMRFVMEIANEMRYPDMIQCIWCGEKILGPTCLPPHADSRCCFSMMPILLVPAFKCLYCSALAHPEEAQVPVLCPYCDIFMERLQVDAEKYNDDAKKLHLHWDGEVKSPCFSDCLQEEIAFEDIEENNREFVVCSDSEGEEDTTKLRTLYERLGQLSLEEILKTDTGDDSEVPEEKECSKRIKLEIEEINDE